jgi:hypothetical protein
MQNYIEQLSQPQKLWQRSEILQRPSPVPNSSGIYAWYFRDIPAEVPTSDCIKHDGLTLLYLGIAPSGASSHNSLRKRIQYHLRGNAYGSTLRLSLGCLLAEELKIELRRVGESRMTFGDGEMILSTWVEDNAFVCWVERQRPWEIEPNLISALSLPLNLEHNSAHPFYSTLSAKRKLMRQRARERPIL